MFPPLFTALRNGTIRYADLALRLLTLETQRLPDRMFAPDPAPSRAAAPRLEVITGRPRRPATATPRSRRTHACPQPFVTAPLTVAGRSAAAPCGPAAVQLPPSLLPYAARRGVAAADGRITGPGTPAGRRRP